MAPHHADRARVVTDSLINDIRHLKTRIGKLQKGQVPFVDMDSKSALQVCSMLDEMGSTIQTAIIPSKD